MKLSLMTSPDAIAPLEQAWNLLLDHSIFRSPFLRHEYQLAWWLHHGGGEWDTADLAVLVAQDEKGDLQGVAPFYVTENEAKQRALRLVGGVEISDYLDVIVDAENATAFWHAVSDWIGRDDFPKWDVIEFYNIPEESISVEILASIAKQKEWTFEKQIYQPCPKIELPNDWDSYLATLSNKFKKNLSRRMRMADNHYIPVTWEFVQPDDFEQRLGEFFDLMAQDPEKHSFLTQDMRTQMEAIVRTAFEKAMMQFAILKLDQKMIAGLLYFDFDNKLWGYNSALDLSELNLSPGLVLKGKHLEWAIEQGYAVYDFMRGDESYKYDFGANATHVLKITMGVK